MVANGYRLWHGSVAMRNFALKSFFSIVAVGILSLETYAQGGLSLAYKEETIAFLEALKESGVEKVACRDLSSGTDCIQISNLISRAASVNWLELNGFVKPHAATRFGAFASNSTIYINVNAEHPKQFMGALGFHELLGLDGNSDLEFEVSTAATVLLDLKNRMENEPSLGLQKLLKRQFDLELNRVQYAVPKFDIDEIQKANGELSLGGSGIIVGGAGDGETLAAHIVLDRHLLGSAFARRPDLISLVRGRVRIELIDGASVSEIQHDGSVLVRASRAQMRTPIERDLLLEKFGNFIRDYAAFEEAKNSRLALGMLCRLPSRSSVREHFCTGRLK